MVDVAARTNRRRNRHFTLPCERCSRRVVWITPLRALRFAAGSEASAFQWQGRRVPIAERLDDKGNSLIDVRCFHCGWERTYPLEALLQVLS